MFHMCGARFVLLRLQQLHRWRHLCGSQLRQQLTPARCLAPSAPPPDSCCSWNRFWTASVSFVSISICISEMGTVRKF